MKLNKNAEFEIQYMYLPFKLTSVMLVATKEGIISDASKYLFQKRWAQEMRRNTVSLPGECIFVINM